MTQLCPYCGHDLAVIVEDGSWPTSADIDVWEGDTSCTLRTECPECGRPVEATATVTLFDWRLDVAPDGEAARGELDLYERRMKGDWS